jgi:hypothetical protein
LKPAKASACITPARARIFEEIRRRILAAKRPVVAQIDPDAAGPGFLLRPHRHGRIVGMNALGGEHVSADQLHNRIERDDAGSNPFGQCRHVDLDAFSRIGGALPVERQMQQELRRQNHGEQARPGQTVRNRTRRRQRLGDRLAIPAGELLAHMLDDFPPARIALQRLRHFLAELAQPDAAALGAGAWRRLDDALNGQIVRQLAWSARCAGASVLGRAGRGDIGLGLFLGLRVFEIFDRKFELLDEQLATFRGLTEHLATRLGEH